MLLTSAPLTITNSSFSRDPALKNHTQKFGMALGLCTAQSPWSVWPISRKGSSHQRPEHPCGRSACPCSTPGFLPASVTAQTMAPLVYCKCLVWEDSSFLMSCHYLSSSHSQHGFWDFWGHCCRIGVFPFSVGNVPGVINIYVMSPVCPEHRKDPEIQQLSKLRVD